MFDKLAEIIASTWSSLIPWSVVRVYEQAAVLRMGRYHRTLDAGFHFTWPLIEEVHVHECVMTTLRLPPQTCTTKDRKSVVVSAVVKFRMEDVRLYVCGVVSVRDVMTDVAMGSILTAVRDVDYDKLVDAPPEGKVASALRRQVKPFGFDVIGVTFTDLGAVRSIRLIQSIQTQAQEVME